VGRGLLINEKNYKYHMCPSFSTKKVISHYFDLISNFNHKKKSYKLARKWFPIYPSKDLAEIVAALMTDGHIDGKSKLILYSNNKNECQWFLDLNSKLFQVKGKLIKYKADSGFSNNISYKGVIHCSVLVSIFILLGVPYGDKTKSSFIIPDWIMNGSEEIKRSFLRVLFNFDGSLSLRKRGLSTLEMNFVTNKHKDHLQFGIVYLNQIWSLLSEFGINAGKVHFRPHLGDKFTIMIFISNNDSVFNFYKNIGFMNKDKNLRLEKAISLIRKYKRVKAADYLPILNDLKKEIGTDKETVEKINSIYALLGKENERIKKYD
jgi:hypothetical protein